MYLIKEEIFFIKLVLLLWITNNKWKSRFIANFIPSPQRVNQFTFVRSQFMFDSVTWYIVITRCLVFLRYWFWRICKKNARFRIVYTIPDRRGNSEWSRFKSERLGDNAWRCNEIKGQFFRRLSSGKLVILWKSYKIENFIISFISMFVLVCAIHSVANTISTSWIRKGSAFAANSQRTDALGGSRYGIPPWNACEYH